MNNRFNLNESDKIHIRNLHGISALNEALILEDSECKICDVDGPEYAFIDATPQNLTGRRRICGKPTHCNGPSCKDGVHTFSDGRKWGDELRGCCQKGATQSKIDDVRWFDDSRKLKCMCYKIVEPYECTSMDKIRIEKLKELDKDPDVQMKKKFFEDYPQYNIRGNYTRGETMWKMYKSIIDRGGSLEEFDRVAKKYEK